MAHSEAEMLLRQIAQHSQMRYVERTRHVLGYLQGVCFVSQFFSFGSGLCQPPLGATV
ncbi:MAG: hypothetical protein JWM11_1579 [Planctomycetaceae bacterium]|nr:hypothetical protein [Planctomycetaceae bacterium]